MAEGTLRAHEGSVSETVDLKDLAATLKYLSSDEGKPILEDYGGMSSASVGVLLRSIVVIEQEGADVFFGLSVAGALFPGPRGTERAVRLMLAILHHRDERLFVAFVQDTAARIVQIAATRTSNGFSKNRPSANTRLPMLHIHSLCPRSLI